MQQESKLLIGALRQAVTGKKTELPTTADWTEFYRLSVSHGVAPMVWHGLSQSPEVQGNMPESLKQNLARGYMQAIFRDTQLEHTKNALTEALSKEGIDHVFLKGAKLKYAYPVPALRTMCDMDILVHTSDYDTIALVAQKLGAEPYYGDGNHRNFLFPGKISVECHPNLVHPGTPVGTQINPGWQYTRAASAGTAREMTPEGMYLNTLCHLAEHFVAGGVGVRFVLDVWVCRHLSPEKYDESFVYSELKRFDLLEFVRKIEALAEMWFGQGESTPLLEELGEYILSSGSHGTSDRAMLNAVSLSPGGSRLSALWHKVFYPRRELETRYPWCEGKAWLLPAAWCARAYGAVTKRGDLIRNWSEGTGKVSRQEAARQREKLSRFGIKRK